MPNTEPQTNEVCAAVFDDITKTIVATVTAALLQARRSGWQVDLVVSHQELTNREAIVVKHAANRATAEVHVALRFHQPDIFTVQLDSTTFGIEFLLKPKTSAMLARQRVYKPESGVVQCALVFVLRISEAGDDANRCRHGGAMLNKKTARWRPFRNITD